MKLLQLSALSLALISAQASADFIVGGNLYTSTSGEVEFEFENGVEETADIDISGTRIFIGSKSERNNRFLISYDVMTMEATEGTAEEDITGLSFDWEFVFGEQMVKPYLGFGFGFYNIEEATILEGTDLAGDDVSAFSFQLAAGMKLELSENVEVDLSFRRQALALEEVIYTDGFSTETLNTVYSHNSLSAGAAFMF